MIWQDIVMTFTNTIFAVSLVPQIWHGFKEKKGVMKHATSVPTFVCLFIVAYCLYTLSLFYSAITAAITGVFWFVLFVQRVMYDKA